MRAAARRDLAAKLAHRDLRLVLHAADIDHAAAGEAADRAVGAARDRHVPADVVLDALALAFEQLVGPALVAHVAAADDELLRPDVEVVGIERAGRDAAGHRRCAAAADIGLVDERDGRLQVGGAQRRPASGKAAADDQDIRFQDVHARRPFHQRSPAAPARTAWERRPPAPSFDQFVTSAVNSFADLGAAADGRFAGRRPRCRLAISGSCRIALISLLSFASTASGVPAGAKNPIHDAADIPG